MKSTFVSRFQGFHVAIIMDGNGRWATARSLPRTAGHRMGQAAVRRVIQAAPRLGIRTLTLFAFSSDNWKRPDQETQSLMNLLECYLASETRECCRNGVRVNVIGRRDRLAPSLLMAIRQAEFRTTFCHRLHLRIAIDYSGQESIRRTGSHLTREEFHCRLNQVVHSDPVAPPVDLLIRTGGERRLSDFLLWESAYAELYFSPILWPDFRVHHLVSAVRDYSSRNRRFGGIDSNPARQRAGAQEAG